MGFKKELRGYDKNEVNVFLNKLNENFDMVSREQKSRIDELKKANQDLACEVNIYRKKERLIERTLTEATRRANDIENELKTQYALEIERLKIFQAKWTNAYEELKTKYHFDKDACNMENVIISTKQSLIDKLSTLNIVLPTIDSEEENQFYSESDRILEIQQEQADKLVRELKEQITKFDSKEEIVKTTNTTSKTISNIAGESVK